MQKLSQVLAIEKGVKGRVYSNLGELHKQSQKSELFYGFVKTFEKLAEEGTSYPTEAKKVQLNAVEILKTIARQTSELFDVTASKDWGNCNARASVLVDGVTLLVDVPVTYLLFLEKQLTDIRTFVEKMSVLSTDLTWTMDSGSGLFTSTPVRTHRTKKVQKPIVLYPATEQHPAQTQLITEDIIEGYWNTTSHSGAIPHTRKEKILERVNKLLDAVKTAREAANGLDAPVIATGEKIFGYLFAE